MIHKPVFDSCYVTFSSGHHPPSFDFIALLAMVCASSLQFLPATPADVCISIYRRPAPLTLYLTPSMPYFLNMRRAEMFWKNVYMNFRDLS
jgi:hypothetical protein